jgi:hypothetical protein
MPSTPRKTIGCWIGERVRLLAEGSVTLLAGGI